MGKIFTYYLYFIIITLSPSSIFPQQLNRIKLLHGQEIFVNGMNVAWNQYSQDVGDQPVDVEWFEEMLDGIKDAGGNAIRWWLFTNAAFAPTFDSNNYVDGPGSSTISNIKTVLDMAQQRGIVISLCLLSFDLFQTDQTGVKPECNRTLMTTDEGIQRFIDNALIPLVTEIGYHPAILCWEIFNEPEGMCGDIEWAGWTNETVFITDVQLVINRCAGAIHRTVPGIPVSNGSWCFKVSTDVTVRENEPGFTKNYYSDNALIAAGGDSDGTLDFYQVHYYDWAEEEFSPFHHPASYWELDKPVVIGEFAAKGAIGFTPTECYNLLYDNGYAGGMSWTYTGHDGNGGLPEASAGMSSLASQYPEAIAIDIPPIAKNDFFFGDIGSPITETAPGLLANDVDHGGLSITFIGVIVNPQNGTVTTNSNGSFTYEAEADFYGLDEFTYRIENDKGYADTATVIIRIVEPAIEIFIGEPQAGNWIFRSPWQDQDQGSGVSNSDNALVISHKAYGAAEAWIINSKETIAMESGNEYAISIDFRDDAANGLLELELAGINEWDNYGPTDQDLQTASFGTPSSSTKYSTEIAEFTPASTGDFHLAFHLVWDDSDGNGPNGEYSSYLKNILIPISQSTVSLNKPISSANRNEIHISYHTSGKLVIYPSLSNQKITVEIFSLTGKRVLSIDSSVKDKFMKIDLNENHLTAGVYIVRTFVKSGISRKKGVFPETELLIYHF